jgi:vacuolar-type H+-ATPase subunit E/Vma4
MATITPMANPPKRLPKELSDVASIESVNALEEKVGKCYSSENYQKFQTDVETIVERYLDTDKAHGKLKTKINRQIKDYLDERGLRNKTFWIPTGIATVAAVATVINLFVK